MLYLDSLDWWILLPLTVAVLLLVSELGYRLGLRESNASLESRKEQTGILGGALLALLGLLLAFSFGIVEGRFASRKTLVIEDANAIGTTYLRAEMLASPHRERVQKLLREYVELRTTSDARKLNDSLVKSGELHRRLWREATIVAAEAPDSEIVSLFVESLNEMIDLHESRVTVALHQRMPAPILATLQLVSLLSIALVGFSAGLSRWRSLLPTGALVIAVSAVVVLIVDLDRPMASRLFHVNQSAMFDLQRSISVRSGSASDSRKLTP